MGGELPERSRLRKALEDLLAKKAPWETEDETRKLLYGICLASSISESRCDEINSSYRKAVNDYYFASPTEVDREAVAKGIEEVLSRYELKGRCLVEKGVEVEVPSVCEGSLDDGLVIVGSRMQFFVNRSARGAVARLGGACAVAVGDEDAWSYSALEELRAGRRGLLYYEDYGAVFAVGQCNLSDLPKLAEEAWRARYHSIYNGCSIRWEPGESEWEPEEVEEAKSIAEDEELERDLKLLRELEGGGS